MSSDTAAVGGASPEAGAAASTPVSPSRPARLSVTAKQAAVAEAVALELARQGNPLPKSLVTGKENAAPVNTAAVLAQAEVEAAEAAQRQDRRLRLRKQAQAQAVPMDAEATSTAAVAGAPPLEAVVDLMDVPLNTEIKPDASTTLGPEKMAELASAVPDGYGALRPTGAIHFINDACPLVLRTSLVHSTPLYCLNLSPDGRLLLAASMDGSVYVYSTADSSKLAVLRDPEEKNIEEFYAARVLPDGRHVAAAGKLKDRSVWDKDDDDNQILPGPIKIFDLETCAVVARLAGHDEEILCIKAVVVDGRNYLVTASQDGYCIRWRMQPGSWCQVQERARFLDNQSNINTSLAFLPDCGNRYLAVTSDEGLNIFDFVSRVFVSEFRKLNTSMCDCVKFVRNPDERLGAGSAYLITKGVELIDESGQPCKENELVLHQLDYPSKDGESFKLTQIRTFRGTSQYPFMANLWTPKFTTNGRYLVCPTANGAVFIWRIHTGALVAVLQDHDEVEVRDVLFHPSLPYLYTCGDDGAVKVYHQPATAATAAAAALATAK